MYLGFEPTSWPEVSRSPVTLAWLAIIVLMFALTGGSSDPELLSRFGATERALLWKGEAWRLLSAGVLHFGFWHFVSNAVAVPGWGSRVERELGSGRTALAIVSCTVASSATSALGQDLVGAGASGGVLGLMGITLVLEFRAAGDTAAFLRNPGVRRRLAALALMLGAGIGLANVPGADAAPLQVDNLGHAGGLGFGVLLGVALTSPGGRRLAVPASALVVLAVLACVQPLTEHGRWLAQYDDAFEREDFFALIDLMKAPPAEIDRGWAGSQLAWAHLALGHRVEAIDAVDAVLPRGPRARRFAWAAGGGSGAGSLAARRLGGRLNRWQVQKAEPWELEARRFRAQALNQLGRNDEALAEIDLVIADDETGAWPRHVRALIYSDLNRSADAQKDLDVALLTEQDPDLYDARAQARVALEDWDGALADVAAGEKLAMPPVRCAVLRGSVEFWRGRLDAAASHFGAALELDPAQPSALLGRCQVLDAAEAEPDEIIAACSQAIAAAPAAAAFVARAAARQRKLEDDPLAATDYDRALELDPTSLRAALGRAWIAMLAEESDALSRMTSLLEQFPDDPAVRALAGEHALNADNEVAARKHFQRALELAPADWNYAARARKVVDALSP